MTSVLTLIFWVVVFLIVVKLCNTNFTLLNKEDYKEASPKGKLQSALKALSDSLKPKG